MNPPTEPGVPRLRFPEFKNAPAWEVKTVGDFFDLTYKAEKTQRFDKEALITVKLHTKGVFKNEKTALLKGGANYFIRRAGQFIFSKIDLLNGAFGLVSSELDGFSSSSDVPAYTFKDDRSALFFVYWLAASYKQSGLERTGTSNTLKRVSKDNFLALHMPTPPLAEQEKIAGCLSSLDEVIAGTANQLEALRRHKQGLMQRLFPNPAPNATPNPAAETAWPTATSQPATEPNLAATAWPTAAQAASARTTPAESCVPSLRFPEFKDAPAWEEKTVGDVLAVRNERAIPSEAAPLFSLTIEHGITAKTDRYNRDFLVKPSKTKMYKVVNPGDIVYNPSNLRWGAISVSRLGHSVVVSPIYEVLFVKDARTTDVEFFINALMRDAQIAVFITKGQGTLVERIAVKIEFFLEAPIMVPSLAEQTKIAGCLSSLDARIAGEVQKLALLKQHKKGLMQRLFPALPA